MIELKTATAEDLPFILEMDGEIKRGELERILETARYFVIAQNGWPVGVLRYGLFWDKIPFLNLIKIKEHARNKGAGREAMALWEEKMKRLGHNIVLTSSQADETAQHFYRKIGYRDAGELRFLGITGQQEAPELFFIKKLEL